MNAQLFDSNFPEISRKNISLESIQGTLQETDREPFILGFQEIAFGAKPSDRPTGVLDRLKSLFALIGDGKLKVMIWTRLKFYNISKNGNGDGSILPIFTNAVLPTIQGVSAVIGNSDNIEPTDEVLDLYCSTMHYFGWKDIDHSIARLVFSSPGEQNKMSHTERIKTMRAVFFENERVFRQLGSGLIRGAASFQSLTDHDTTPKHAGEEDSPEVTERERIIIDEADIVFTDVNDTNDVSNSNGGLRRGSYALQQGKPVIFITGDPTNRKKIDDAFGVQHKRQYAYLGKPVTIQEIKEAIETLLH